MSPLRKWWEGVPVGRWVRYADGLSLNIFGGGSDFFGGPGFKGVFGHVYRSDHGGYRWQLITEYDYGAEEAMANGFPPLVEGHAVFAFMAKRRCWQAYQEYRKRRAVLREELRIRRAIANDTGLYSSMAFQPTGSSKPTDPVETLTPEALADARRSRM